MYFNRSSKRSRRSWSSRPCCSVDWLEKRPAPNRTQSSKTLWLLCRGNSQVQQNPADSRRWSNPYKVSRSQAFSLETLAPDMGTDRVNKGDASLVLCDKRYWYHKGLALLIFIKTTYIQGFLLRTKISIKISTASSGNTNTAGKTAKQQIQNIFTEQYLTSNLTRRVISGLQKPRPKNSP